MREQPDSTGLRRNRRLHGATNQLVRGSDHDPVRRRTL
jgi:hypothetical protein